jgi:hypothetical protein
MPFSKIYTQKQKHAQTLGTSAFGHVFQFSCGTLFLPNDVLGERICRGDWEANQIRWTRVSRQLKRNNQTV